MKAIRLKLYQDYTRFNGSKFPQVKKSYLLPPFSTIIGFIHSSAGWKEYHPMDLFISGSGIYNHDEIKRYWVGGGRSFGSITPEQKKRWSVIVPDAAKSGYYKGWTQTIKNFDFLVDFNLTCYIIPNNEDEIMDIKQALLYPKNYPSLGEWGNLCRIDEVKILDLTEYQEEKPGCLRLDSYIPVRKAGNNSGTVFRLHRNYSIINDRRVFNDENCFMLCSGQEVKTKYYDGEHPVVFLDR